MLPRDVYVAKMEAQLMGWEDELAWLTSHASWIATQSSAQFQRQLLAAQLAHQSVRNKFERLKKSGADRWSALAAGLEVAWGELTA